MSSQPNLTLVEPETGGPSDPRIGTKFDNRYVVKKLLGQGGMGVVYFALHDALEKPVAIKVLRPDVSRDEKIMARFKREARAASAIGSPHICDVSDFGTLEDGSTYFVMEMLDGPSLSKILTGKPLETARILKIGSQLAEALGAAHARQIVHRDLKPDNVHLVKHGSDPEFVKVLDFGIAKVATSGDTKLTQAGQVFGTPHYMSPEQCAGHDVDHRTDIYALGVMLYEMSCGRVPFDADNLMGLLTKHVYEQPIPPRQLPPPVDVPPGLEAIILKCLAKKPSSRYQTMAELKADLDALAKGATPEAVMSEIDRSLPPKPETPFETGPGIVPGEPPATSTQPPVQTVPPVDKKGPSGLTIALIALPVLAAAAFGVTYFAMPSDDAEDPRPVASDPAPRSGEGRGSDPPSDPPADPGRTAGSAADPGQGTETVEVGNSPDNPTVVLHTEPTGAEVFGPDGSLVGNTPVTIIKPARGEPAIEYRIQLSGFAERTFTVGAMTVPEVHLTMDQRRTPAATGRRGGTTTSPGTTTPPVDPAIGSPTRVPTGTTRPPATTGTPGTGTTGTPGTGPSREDLRNPFGN
ncbi:MAG: serine/threonine protein kinase [Sandaracinaceae bacterium]|nr:serine/threonine protein kinase [Sandaracinaceae bacterium]